MPGFYGADTEQLRDFADRLQQGRSRLEDLAGQVTMQALAVDWEGPDADAFRETARGQVSGFFDTAGSLLDVRNADAVKHADEQDQASEPEGGGVLGPLGDLVDGVLEGVATATNSLVELGKDAWSLATDSGLQILNSVGGVLDDAADIGEKFFDKSRGLLGKALGAVGKVFTPLGTLGGINSLFFDSEATTAEKWSGGFAVAGGVLAGAAALVTAPAWVTGLGIGAAAAGAVSLGIAAGEMIVDGWDGIKQTASDTWNTMKDFGSSAVDLAKDAAGAIGDTASAAWDGFTDWAGGLI